MCKPILKWVGGKRQLFSDIQSNLPTPYNRYFEPFVGGGAVFFSMKQEKCCISDYNPDLINVYKVVKDSPEKLINSLRRHKNTSEYYYRVRAMDRNQKIFDRMTDVQKASRFIFLNKTGFNGLYRVNKQGYNNVPFGGYKNPKIFDEENIMECSQLLKSTTICQGDFENIKSKIKQNDFVYLDPPYVPISKTSNFTSYTGNGFGYEDQVRLKEFCDYIDSVGAYFMLSNSSAQEVKDLYNNRKYLIKTVSANRAINCKANGRGKIDEVLVMNYKPIVAKKAA